jgi:hypothetical protein
MNYSIYLRTDGSQGIYLLELGKSFILDKNNSDYQQFKLDIANGVELLDANANPVTGDALTTFIGTLP